MEQKPGVVDKPLGLGAQIAESLKQSILEGHFAGGEQLAEQELQTRFGVSRSPVREAFRELEKLGLVEIIPRRGTFVKRISRKDIEDHFPVRAALEGLAARLAAPRMTKAALAAMKQALGQMERAAGTSDTRNYYRQHLAFHEYFIAQAGNDLLATTLTNLRMQGLWHRFSYRYYQEDLATSLLVHQKIFALFSKSGSDPAQIAALVEEHINVALDSFLSYLHDTEKTEGERRSGQAALP